MKNKTQKNIKWLSVAILFLATLSVVFIYCQMVNQLWLNHPENHVVWNPDGLAWQIGIVAGRFVCVTLLYVFCWIFLIRTNRSLRTGEIFPKSNIALLRWTALVSLHRLDLGVNFHKPLRNGGERIFNISIYNVYSHQNPFLVYDGSVTEYREDPDGTYHVTSRKVLKQLSIFPIMPSISWSYKF